jgi:glycosyltransferase involved in cell wall biosynthesis
LDKRLLLSAYACEPFKGSEPGVGWNYAIELSKYFNVWVITRANNAESIKSVKDIELNEKLHFIYYDLPKWILKFKKGNLGVQIYYYLWQIGIYFEVKKMHGQLNFDLIHHVTFGRYWSPSFLSLIGLPFIWGPVGGGESAPIRLWSSFNLKGIIYELTREIARILSNLDPFISITARRSDLILVKAKETKDKVRKLSHSPIIIWSEVGFSNFEFERLISLQAEVSSPIRFISIGRLVHIKGYNLSIAAFAKAEIADSEYWIVGDGPEREKLENLCKKLGVNDRVHFFGWLQRDQALEKLKKCHIMLHPSLHDSGGWACPEAMAAAKPVICLDIGGPAFQVTAETGFKIPPLSYAQVVTDISSTMTYLVNNPIVIRDMGKAAQEHIRNDYRWESVGKELSLLINDIPKINVNK